MLGLPQGRVRVLYNQSEGFLEDLAETYRLQQIDAIPSNFWKLYNPKSNNLVPSAAELHARALQRMISRSTAQQDINDFVDEIISSINESRPKTIIIAHSQGTIFANLVYSEIIRQNSELQSCIGTVMVGAAASHIDSEGGWSTSHQDTVIAAARAYLPVAPLASNFDLGLADQRENLFVDFLNHNFLKTYLNGSVSWNHINSNITSLKNQLDNDCGEKRKNPNQSQRLNLH